VWRSNDNNAKSDWNWRRPAVYKKTEWPRWGARVLLNISGSVDTPNRVIALGVVVNAVGTQADHPNVKQMWHGSLKLTADDLPETGEVTVPMACLAAATLGLRVCIDLSLDKLEIMVGTDHSIVEAQFTNANRKIAADLRPIVDVLDDYRAQLQFPVRVTQTTASENQATDVARNCRQSGYSTVGDRKLYEAIQGAVEARGNPGGLNALKMITSSVNQQYQAPYYQQNAIADYAHGAPGQPAGQGMSYPAIKDSGKGAQAMPGASHAPAGQQQGGKSGAMPGGQPGSQGQGKGAVPAGQQAGGFQQKGGFQQQGGQQWQQGGGAYPQGWAPPAQPGMGGARY
jgi:hypothetical protein